MAKTNKLIVTMKSALQDKYKNDFNFVEDQLKQIISNDKMQRGLTTLLIYLDDATQMKSLGAKPVTTKTSLSQYKASIDQLCNSQMPDYLMIFGAIDIVPHQRLINPLFGADDDDRYAPSDLPYACDAAYSTDISKFIAPTRVVGRLADINGKADKLYVQTVIRNSIKAKTLSADAYGKNYFGITAKVWNGSTTKSLNSVFGNHTQLLTVPTNGPTYTAAQLNALSHFINCHGSPADPTYYGQQGSSYPKALESTSLSGKILPNTIVAAECCYGAQLYKPSGSILPIVNTYFREGAIAMVGSSTIAYGPADDNDQADYICQYFFNYLIGGASIGRAMLEARHKYILNHGPDLSPTDLKTIAQFNLMGDPSVSPVQSNKLMPSMSKAKGAIPHTDNSRIERRKFLISKGNSLKSYVNTLKKGNKSGRVAKHIEEVLEPLKMKSNNGHVFHIKENKTNAKLFQKTAMNEAKFHVFSEKGKHVHEHRLVTIKEINGVVVHVKEYVRR